LRQFTIAGTSVTDVTRVVSGWIGWPVDWLIAALTEGHYYDLAGGSEYWLAPLPWFGIAALLVVLAYAAGGLRSALMTLGTLAYVLLLGLWISTVTTLVAVLFSVIAGVVIGGALGIAASRSRSVSAMLAPVYDALQTIPVFSYLALVIMVFGFGQVAGLVATVVFAMPPMARATELALNEVSPELKELSEMTGCSPRQKLWLVDLPSRSRVILLGVNQVIMLSLAMVIITSVIGAGGLGGNVVSSLRSMRLTEALLAGMAITMIAIVLDRTTVAWAERNTAHKTTRLPLGLVLSGILAVSIGCALLFPEAGLVPDDPVIDIGRQIDHAIDTFNRVAAPFMTAIQNVFIGWLLRPARELFIALPWAPTVALLAGLAWMLGTRKLALTVAVLMTALALLGIWEKAMLSLYLVLVSIIAALVISLPLGIAAGLNDRVDRVSRIIVDLIQTLPTFVYLIPVVALFGVGDFAAFIAITIFVVAPIVRYTAAGLRQVPVNLSEVAIMTGCTPLQRLRFVLLPGALPQLLLGLNQSVMLGFSMLVITALVGTRGLEETTLVAVAKVRPGDGLVAGFGIAVLAIVVDRIVGAASKLAERRYQPSIAGGH
jgi:glycine betaine/proline transport system permease protein